MRKRVLLIISAVILIVATVTGGIFVFQKLKPQKIKTAPAVFDMGNDYYCVAFESTLKGSGYVKYTVDGEEKILWDATSGIIATHDTVHTILVPKNELINNDYVVGSQHVPFKFAYTANKGSTAESEAIHFNGEEKEDGIRILAITDIHEMEDSVRKAVAQFDGEFDMVVMLGDITSNFEKKEKFTDHILADAAELSGGKIPVVYTRGNHETRGEYASQLLRYFPTETGEFFYTFNFGGLSAVVLDSGEDKEDSHVEYSGLIDFNTYREKEYEWINSLEAEEFTGRYKIVFSHEPRLSDHFGKNWSAPFENLGFDLIVGGHLHRSELIDGGIPSFVACGKYENGWAASSITLENGEIKLLTINTEGETLMDRTISVEE